MKNKEKARASAHLAPLPEECVNRVAQIEVANKLGTCLKQENEQKQLVSTPSNKS